MNHKKRKESPLEVRKKNNTLTNFFKKIIQNKSHMLNAYSYIQLDYRVIPSGVQKLVCDMV